MSNTIPALFKKSLIAATVVSLSACSTTPRIEDYDLSRVGEGILTAGRATADVSQRVWNKTTYLLGFSEGDEDTRSDEGLLMDAEDVALLGEGTNVTRDTTIRPIAIRSAIPNRPLQEQTPTNAELPGAGQAAALETSTTRDANKLTQSAINAESIGTQTESGLIAENRVHRVAASETLWDIAKATTGDANNWHVLADLNNLGPGAAVFPGDLLIIPADMIKLSQASSTALENETTAQQEPEQIFVDTQNLTSSIKSQVSEAAAQPQLEASSSVQATLSDVLETEQTGGKAFKLNPGETLWDLAKRTTGDATNWKAIARQNNFSAQQATKVRPDQTIYVPESLIESDLEATIIKAKPVLDTVANDKVSEVDTTLEAIQTAADTARPSVEPAPVQTDALRTLTISSTSAFTDVAEDTDLLSIGNDPLLSTPSTAMDAEQSIKIVEATFKTEEIAPPLTQGSGAIKSVGTSDHSPEQIMVSGTYYPKAIYNNANFSSSLLMRVSPGTTLQVSKAMGNWYQVKTSKGLGYVHQRDIK